MSVFSKIFSHSGEILIFAMVSSDTIDLVQRWLGILLDKKEFMPGQHTLMTASLLSIHSILFSLISLVFRIGATTGTLDAIGKSCT